MMKILVTTLIVLCVGVIGVVRADDGIHGQAVIGEDSDTFTASTPEQRSVVENRQIANATTADETTCSTGAAVTGEEANYSAGAAVTDSEATHSVVIAVVTDVLPGSKGDVMTEVAETKTHDVALSVEDGRTKPTASDSLVVADVVDTTKMDSLGVRPGFFRRFYNYFANSNEDKTMEKKFDFSIIGGPHFSSDTKLGLGLVAAGLYRIDKSDLSIPPSNVSLFGDITTTGFYLLGIRGNTLFKGAKYRLDFNAYFFSMPSAFWGLGYDNGMYAKAETYKRLQNQVKADFMVRVAKNFYVGANASFNFIEGQDFSNIDYLQGQDTRYINIGVGAFLMYDSRDIITNAWRGVYAKLDHRFFPEFMGNKGGFSKTEFNGNAYHPIWKGGVMAYDLHAVFNTGDVPWTMLALMGGSNRMRGYYEGRFRDKQMIEAQIELRQKVYGRSGIAVWVGAGNVFPSFNKLNFAHTLPNYGIGYRWEFKKRMNVRLDYGFGKGQSGFIFNINEAF